MLFPARRSLLLLLAASPLCACAKRPDGPNILVITLDTTRRDHLGMYGYPLPTSPNLDRLAKDALVYTNAYAVSSWTMPTHASMFTGKFPSSHGAQYDPDGPLNLGSGIGAQFGAYRARPIAENEITLAMLLAEEGYETAGIIAGPWMLKQFRLGKGFEHYDDSGVSALNGRPAADVTRAAIEYVDEHADDPFFLFLNYYDPHSPWFEEPARDAEGKVVGQPKPFQDLTPVFPKSGMISDYTEFANVCYDAEIRYMDREIGRLLDHLKSNGLYEKTWIFVLADHGELMGEPVLGETGLWGHGDSLTEPEIHIPFLVKEPGPNARTGTDASFVQQTDLLPTICARLGIALPPNVQGTPLGQQHDVISELVKLPMMNRTDGPNPKDWRHLGNWVVLVEGKNKFGWSENGTHTLVDLAADPLERTNLYEARKAEADDKMEGLLAYLTQLPRPGATGEVEELDDATQDALKGLGYVGDDDEPRPNVHPAAQPPKEEPAVDEGGAAPKE
ncbi:MAG: sulfatase [Planctomycetota bacterium]